ncbi:hypothetical protein CVIRNUC_008846 [Coccomyxa viridis]|uniref:carotenoid 9,10-dioxygenase n=1 Tax=Coccomyxa viridis TaxID=1274662 RepID=A0AAV1IGP6_9CHLO|nr:hypothetical protein CVIRNUC_008846 [Coccomyxa viridis]
MDLTVDGTLPSALNGAYVRNGPNPQHMPVGGHHWFDGDGMLHTVRIKKGKASYSNAYVQTSRYKQEKNARRPLSLKLGGMVGGLGVIHYIVYKLRERWGLFKTKDGTGPGNTALAFHNKQLLALVETDLPYIVRVNDNSHTETLERQTYGGNLAPRFTAHPKIDPATGTLYGFGYNLSKPELHYFAISSGGMVKEDFKVTLQQPTMQHDFAMTEDYVIFLDFPLVSNPENMKRGLPMLMFDRERSSRIGVLRKDTSSELGIRWFKLPAMYAYHVANAWQERGNNGWIRIRIFLCVYDDSFSIQSTTSSTLARMSEITIELERDECSVRSLADELRCEFPVVPDRLVGRRTRYTYAVAFEKEAGHLGQAAGLVKFDLGSPDKSVAAMLRFGSGRTGEDDGYLVLFMYNERTNSSDFVVYDARTFSNKPVAVVSLPQRVPYGFHGKHINAAQFQSQFPFDIHFLPDI